jgi:primosomal protein N' (replication factor Y)
VSGQQKIARVSLDTRLPQLDRLFDYLIPDGMEISEGVRVKVPLRSQTRLHSGYVVEVVTHSKHPESLAPVAECVSPVPVLGKELWSLCEAVATRQAGNVSDVLRLAIPARFVRAEKAWLQREQGEFQGPAESLKELPGYPEGSLSSLLTPGARFLLQQRGGVIQTPDGERLGTTQPVATLAASALHKGQSTIVVVPDWRDIEFYRQSLEDHLPEEDLVVWDHNLTPAQKYAQFLKGLEGRPRVILGNRHAVFAPAHNLGLLVVVDDGDEAHQEPLAPYPHSRDIALIRHHQSGAALVFASLVPSLNTLRWVEMGYFKGLSPVGAWRPTVIPTALALGAEASTAPGRLPPQAYQAAKEGLQVGPVLVQVFRAGFAPGLSCVSCGEAARCERCQGPLRLEGKSTTPSCGWCARVHATWKCGQCNNSGLKPRGSGVGRTASDLGRAFPGVPVIQADGATPLLRVSSTPALVVATRGAEPLADGGYVTALLLDGAAMLQRESLTTLEDSLRGWEHAISLVSPGGKVFITEIDQAPALAVATGSYRPLLVEELTQREALRLPPAVRFVAVSGPPSGVQKLVDAVGGLSPEIDVLGPVRLEEGIVRSVLRFPYALGDGVQKTIRSAYLKALSGPSTATRDRLRVVFDNTRSLDALTSE